jgi:GNAT superfamily N-acetyltransferase
VNRTKQLKSEIVSVELLPEVIRCVLGHLEEDTVSAILKGLVSIREEYPGLRLAGARTCDEDGNIIAAAYLCEYPGALGVLVGPWTVSSEWLTSQDSTDDTRNSIDDSINHLPGLSGDPAVKTIKLLLDVSRQWQVELVQSLDHRSCEVEANAIACGDVVTSSRNDLLGKRLEASGMQWLTTLEHLELQLGPASFNSASDSDSICADLRSPYSWTRFRWQDASSWSAWLDGTYIDSMDCPELNGIRSTSMTLQGYWALTGVPTKHAFFAEDDAQNDVEFDAEQGDRGLGQSGGNQKERNIEWWGLRSLHRDSSSQAGNEFENLLADPHRNCPIEAGFMLSQRSRDAWELTYMGVHQRYRGNMLGKACLAKAIERVARWNGLRLSLAVDVRNQVCRDLYKALGFKPVSEIDAWIYNPSKNDSRKS